MSSDTATTRERTDLSTHYLGLRLCSPIVASASPMTNRVDSVAALEEAGVGAVVLPSLFEEEILAEEHMVASAFELGAEQHYETHRYFPLPKEVRGVAERYMARLEATKAIVRIPVIASLNAWHAGAWSRYARLLADAGADAIELNVYRVATDDRLPASELESAELAFIAEVCERAGVPVAVKLSPFYSSFANFASRVVAAGASGLVLFNRFYQPDLDLETMEVLPRVHLSSSTELGLPLRWTAILRPQLGDEVSLAASSGVEHGSDVAKLLAVGADVVMVASELLRSGVEGARTLEASLRDAMELTGHTSVAELHGCASRASAARSEAFERAQYVRTLRSWGAGLPGQR